MTQTIDRPNRTAWSDLVLTPAEQTADYVRRIHWWVRLFGIIWIVMPIVMTILLLAFMFSAASR